jgi:hypothetical protein
MTTFISDMQYPPLKRSKNPPQTVCEILPV